MAKQKNIIECARDAGNFSKLLRAIDKAGLEGTFEGKGPYTLFAPTDSAFSKLPSNKFDDLMESRNKSQLQELFKYHVIPKKVRSEDVRNTKIETLAGPMVRTKISGQTIRFGDARVNKADIECSNGFIHAIDRVVMPPDFD